MAQSPTSPDAQTRNYDPSLPWQDMGTGGNFYGGNDMYDMIKRAGYGGTVYDTNWTDRGGQQVAEQSINPEFQNWLNSKNYGLMSAATGDNSQWGLNYGLLDKNSGNMIGQSQDAGSNAAHTLGRNLTYGALGAMAGGAALGAGGGGAAGGGGGGFVGPPAELAGGGGAGVGGGVGGGAAGSPYASAAAIQATGGITPAMQAAIDQAAVFNAGGLEALQPSLVSRAINAISSNPLGAAQVGLAGYGAVKQGSGGAQAQNQFSQIAQPTKDVSNELLQRFRTGQISGADAFAIQDWQQKQKASIDQYFSQAGLQNSTMHLDALSRMTQQAEGMRQQAIQNLLSGGLRAAGISDPTLVAGINAGLKQDQASQDAMARFLSTLAQMNTSRPPTPVQPAPAGQTGSPG